ncbi:MAG: cell division protein ZapB [Treponema sp.]|nr:cell division protein ZapB [Treponema sp.]
MISLDQVLLLQEKVETAVQKITALSENNARLESENDALRSKCAELSKALEEKTELVKTFENQQNRIESGILNALEKLDSVENALLDSKSGTKEDAATLAAEKNSLLNEAQRVHREVPEEQKTLEEPVSDNTSGQNEDTVPEITVPVAEDSQETELYEENAESDSYEETQVNGDFDIF